MTLSPWKSHTSQTVKVTLRPVGGMGPFGVTSGPSCVPVATNSAQARAVTDLPLHLDATVWKRPLEDLQELTEARWTSVHLAERDHLDDDVRRDVAEDVVRAALAERGVHAVLNLDVFCGIGHDVLLLRPYL